ncbi:hypothetical protein, partial [Herbaspirillum autotrophicum]|uniref:hypothetical protein n=1 Tax=Herbaspirillum autotrophicum TaxID=180195 RepID=UPI000ACB88C2
DTTSGKQTELNQWNKSNGQITLAERFDAASGRLLSLLTWDGATAGLTSSSSWDAVTGHQTELQQWDAVTGNKTLYQSFDAATGVASQLFTWDVNGVATDAPAGWRAGVNNAVRVLDMQYDERGNQILQRDGAGNTITRTYNAANQVVTETHYAQADDGAGATQPATTRYVYDNGNLLRFVVSAEGRVTEYRYNSYGERVAQIDYAQASLDVSGLGLTTVPTEAALVSWVAGRDLRQTNRTDLSYDARGQLQKMTAWGKVDAAGNGVSDGQQSETQFVYDQSGQLLKTVSATGGVTQYTYDGLGRVIAVRDGLNQLTTTSYDDAGNRVTVTAANGLSSTSVYDRAGRLVSVTQNDAAAVALGSTQYFYDAAGRLGMTQDPTGVRAWRLYDAAGRKLADVDGDGTLTEYVYDSKGRVVHTVKYATAVSLGALVDASGQPLYPTLASLRPAGNGQDLRSWRFYDQADRLVRTIEGGQQAVVSDYHYDGASRLLDTVRYATTVDASGLGNIVAMADITPTASADDRVARNFYDRDGLLLASLDGEGYLTELHYDAAGHLSSRVRYASVTDVALRGSGTLAQLRPAAAVGDIINTVLLNNKGQVAGEVDGEGYLTEKVYDGNGNVTGTIRYATKVSVPLAAGATLATVRPSSTAMDRSTSATYDANNRLIAETNAEGTVTTYRYDQVGQLIQTTRGVGSGEVRTGNARYDVQGRLIGELTAQGSALLDGSQSQAQIEAIWAQYGVRHSYDAAGRRLSTIDQNGNKSVFFYDVDGHQTHSINALGEVSENRYNVLGQLTASVRLGSRINAGGLQGGLVTSSLLDLLALGRNAALDSEEHFAYNAQGLLVSRTDALGHVTRLTYDAFGAVIGTTATLDDGRGVTQTVRYDHNGRQIGSEIIAAGVPVTTATQYDAFGRVIATTDANGQVRRQEFDRLGRVVQTMDALNAARSSTYDAFDRVLTSTDSLGHVTRYGYDDVARSITLTTPEGITVTTVHDRFGQTSSVTDGVGNVTHYSYDLNGRLTQTQTALNQSSNRYDAAGRLMETTDANGTVVRYSYDAANRLLQRQVDPSGLNLRSRYQYDAKGQQIEATDANGVITQTVFDLNGQTIRQTLDPAGLNLTTQYSYDAQGHVLSVTSAGGQVTQYVYDDLGRRIAQRVDPNGLNLVTRTSYDANGNAVVVTDANGNLQRYVYDAQGRLVYSVDALGNVQHKIYDSEGRVIRSEAYAVAIDMTDLPTQPTPAEVQARVLLSAARDVTSRNYYDADGRLSWTVNGVGAVVQYRYDANGRLVQNTAYATPLTTSALAGLQSGIVPTPVSDSARDIVTRTAYDALGRATFQLDGAGGVVALRYDGNGNVIERIAYTQRLAAGAAFPADVAALADGARDAHVIYRYDAANRLIYVVDGVGAVTRNDYDNNGNLIRQTAYATTLPTPIGAGTHPETVNSTAQDRITTYIRDTANRLNYEVDANGVVTQQRYDANGNVVLRTTYAKALTGPVPVTAAAIEAGLQPDATHDRTLRFSYDGANRQRYSIDALGYVTNNAYDSNGNLLHTVRYANAVNAPAGALSVTQLQALVTVDVARDVVEDRVYDESNRLLFVIDGLGVVKGHQYDALGNIVTITNYGQSLDAAGRAEFLARDAYYMQSSPADRVTAFVYDSIGKLVLGRDALGNTESYAYDAFGRRTLYVNKLGAHTSYDYDAAGRLITTTDALGNTERSVFDGAGNVIGSTNKLGGVFSYTYDARGQRLSETLPVTSANAAGVQIAVVNRVQYDAFGNRTQTIEAAGLPEQRTTTLTYDRLGRQISKSGDAVQVYVAGSGWTSLVTPVETLRYDAFGNVLEKTDANGKVTRAYYDANNHAIAEINATGTLTTRQFDAAGNAVVVRVYGDAVTVPVGDALPAGNVLNMLEMRQVYDAGNHLVQTIQANVNFAEQNPTTNSFSYATADITQRTTYNAAGQVVMQQDGIGNRSYTYYNRLGQKVLTIDAAGYAVQWITDAEGHVLKEVAYANKYPASADPFTETSDPDTLIQKITADAKDRTVDYTYDSVGRKLSETRHGVDNAVVNGSTGQLTQQTGDATVRYVYNAAGDVLAQTDATGKVSNWQYDVLSRKTAVLLPTIVDYAGNTVRQTTTYAFNGLNLVTRQTQVGVGGAADHVLESLYGVGGRRLSLSTAQGEVIRFGYDAVGNTTAQISDRLQADGSSVHEMLSIAYDGLNHEVKRFTGLADAADQPVWNVGGETSVRYDGYGNIVAKTTGNGGVNGRPQEFYDYDSAGRIWRSNTGGGITKVYLYDRNGRPTMTLESQTLDLSSMRLDQILSEMGKTNSPIAQTITVYDARGQVVSVIQ